MATLPEGKYSFQRLSTSFAVASSQNNSFGYQGFMRASMATGAVWLALSEARGGARVPTYK